MRARHIFKTAGFLTLLAVLAFPVGTAIWAGTEIASPSRRKLMDYHLDFFTRSEAHGIRIEAFTTTCGTPCLMVVPSGKPGERGAIIRKQLKKRGLVLAPYGQLRGTLVLSHGRKGRKEDYLPIAERLCAAGFRCLIPDLPGHGDHPADIATYGLAEAGLPARVLDEASTKHHFDKHPAGLMGMSMGGSVAVHAAVQPDAPWQALVVVASFDSFASAVEGQASRHIGTTLGQLWAEASDNIYRRKSGVSIDDIHPSEKAASIRIPTLIAHGSADEIVSIDSGLRLFQALPESTPKKWVEIPGAGHDNVLVTDYPIYADIAEWMLLHLPLETSASATR